MFEFFCFRPNLGTFFYYRFCFFFFTVSGFQKNQIKRIRTHVISSQHTLWSLTGSFDQSFAICITICICINSFENTINNILCADMDTLFPKIDQNHHSQSQTNIIYEPVLPLLHLIVKWGTGALTTSSSSLFDTYSIVEDLFFQKSDTGLRFFLQSSSGMVWWIEGAIKKSGKR